MKKDEIKRQTLIKLRRNVKIFIYFLKKQRSRLLSVTYNLTLLHFFYSVFLIEFRAYYKLNRYLSIKNIYFFFRKKSLFFFSTLILKNYRLFIYFSPYLLNFLTWADIYKYIKFKNFRLSLDFFQDYIMQKDLFLFRFFLSFKLTNFFLLLTKKKNLISVSRNQTKYKNVFYTRYLKKVLQNTIFLLTFQLTSNWYFTVYNLTNYFSFILTTIFRSLRKIKKQLKIKIFVKMFKITLKARKNFGFRKFKKLPSKKINVI